MVGFAGLLRGLVGVFRRLGGKELCSCARSSMSWVSSSFSFVWPLRMLRRYLERLESWLVRYCSFGIAY